jgi:CBS domain-containing protein
MTTLRELLDQKGANVWSIRPDASVRDAIATMADKDIGSLVVMEGDKLVGIVTERHYARKVVLNGRASLTTPVRDIMEKHVITARPGQSVEESMATMVERRVRHLPVVEGEKVVGVVSLGDLAKSIIGDQAFIIDELVAHYLKND